jgi:hypothetical protein
MTLFELVDRHPVVVLGGSLIGAAVSVWLQGAVKRVLSLLFEWLFLTREVPNNDDFNSILCYLNAHAKSFGTTKDSYWSGTKWIPRLKRSARVWYLSTVGSYRLFIYRGRPILFRPYVNGGSTNPSTYPSFAFLRGTVNWHRLLIDSAEFTQKNYQDALGRIRRYKVTRLTGMRKDLKNDDSTATSAPESNDGVYNDPSVPIGWSKEDLINFDESSIMSTLSLTQKMKDVIRDFKFWRDQQEWYVERGIAWRRGYLLHGKPGTGKTSLVRAIAYHFDIPTFVFDLSTMDNFDFLAAWKKTQGNYRRIVLFEDFDTVFHGRENVLAGSGLSFETILNVLDGIERENGLALFVTTNHVEHIDDALGAPRSDGGSTRPGRIDVIVEMEEMDRSGRLKIAKRILKDDAVAERLTDEGAGDTPAQFEDRCSKYAKEALWATFGEGFDTDYSVIDRKAS